MDLIERITRPVFVTFTGVDDAALVKGMGELSGQYPIEWGVLIDRRRMGTRLFPDARQVDAFRRCGVRLCAHICGDLARDIAGGDNPALNLAGFSRIQVNHSRSGSRGDAVRSVRRYAAAHGVRAVLQCSGPFPAEDDGVDWLYDVSFGEGVQPASWPAIVSDRPLCGLAGGIGPDNVVDLLARTAKIEPDTPYWIDMESGVRSHGSFDLAKCASVCRALYGRG